MRTDQLLGAEAIARASGAGWRRALALGRLAVHRGDQILQEIAHLGLALQMIEEERRDLRERLLEAEAFAGPSGDLLAALREIFVERFCVARQLRSELF